MGPGVSNDLLLPGEGPLQGRAEARAAARPGRQAGPAAVCRIAQGPFSSIKFTQGTGSA